VKITIEMGTPKWLGSRRLRWARPLVLTLTLVVGVPTVLASDGFSDVDASSVHHDNINRLATAGVTLGCGGGQFCPGDAVLRDQMASFLVRGLPRVASASWVDVPTGNVEPIATASLTIDTGVPPGATNSTGFLKIDASVWLSSGADCVGRLYGTVQQGGVTVATVPSGGDTQSRNPVGGGLSLSATSVVEVGSGTYTVSMNARGENPSDGGESCGAIVNGDVTVLYVPFDGDANNATP
jgi:S-layer homology domain